MLRTETITIAGTVFDKNYSDEGRFIRQTQTGNLYVEAIDIPGHFTYEETAEPIDPEEPGDEAQPSDYEAALGEMGVETP